MIHSLFSIIGVAIWVLIIACIVGFLKKSGLNIHRSRYNRKLGGVCGGIGEAMGIDPTVVRLVWILFTAFGGSGIFAYVIACLVMPEDY